MLSIANRFSSLLRSNVCCGIRVAIRTQSTSRTTDSVDLPVGGSGSIKLDINYPTQVSRFRPSVLVQFPAGPVTSSSILPDILSKAGHASFLASTTIITVNYRLSAPSLTPNSANVFRYPQPIHDSTIAFSHILTEIAPSLVDLDPSPLQPWDPQVRPRIMLTGTHIGAALVTMLALTHPNHIHSVVIADPLVDWVILDELLNPTRNPVSGPTRPRRASSSNFVQDAEGIALAAKRLIDIRTKLFSSPSAYFDPFASPTLLLRAPGRDTPRTHTEALGILNADLDFGEDGIQGDESWKFINGRDDYSEADETNSPHPSGPDFNRPDFPNGVDNDAAQSREDHDIITEAIGTDSFAFGPYDDDLAPSLSTSPSIPTSSPPPPSSLSSTAAESKQLKRRKVLRRWPPLSNPDSVLLPYFHIFTTSLLSSSSSSTTPAPAEHQASHCPLDSRPSPPAPPDPDHDPHLSLLLQHQATELSDLLRRVCFHGREKGLSEERVTLHSLPTVGERDQDQAQKESQNQPPDQKPREKLRGREHSDLPETDLRPDGEDEGQKAKNQALQTSTQEVAEEMLACLQRRLDEP